MSGADDAGSDDKPRRGLRSTIASFEQQIAALKSALVKYANDVEIYKRKLFGTKSERSGTSELQLTLGTLLLRTSASRELP